MIRFKTNSGPRQSLATIPVLLCLLAGAAASGGAQTADKQPPDAAALQALLDRVSQLEARVQQLEAAQRTSSAGASCQTTPVAGPAGNPADASAETPLTRPAWTSAPADDPMAPAASLAAAEKAMAAPDMKDAAAPLAQAEQTQSDTAMSERMDVSKTLLRIRGFGDVSFHSNTREDGPASFALGQLDLFVTSDVSEAFRFLSEIVFEGSQDNIYGATVGQENNFSVDVERYLLQYSLNDYLRLSVGRGHTAIGYYNTAYHHSTWMQTTTARPFLFEFEDSGGILPVHNVGATVSGLIPSGALGLHYVAEIGNGRESRDPLDDDPVQNVTSDQNHKAFNLAMFARPASINGLQTGISVYRDVLSPNAAPRIGETIVAAHAVFIRPRYEWLSEAIIDRHAPFGSPTVFHIPGFYSQVSRQFGSYRPYFRYEYLNSPRNEPVFPDVGLRHGPLAGVRYDANESVALKLEYQYTVLRDLPSMNEVVGQVGFTF